MARMKDSGIKWIGDIPENWEISKLKTILKKHAEKNSGDRELLSVYLNLGVISYSDSTGMQVHKPSEDLSKYQNVDIGDFVLNNQQAWRGSVGVSKYKGIISPAYFIYKFRKKCNPIYMNFLLRSPFMVQQYELASRGIGTIQRNLFEPWFLNCIFFLPPLETQITIANFLEKECTKIDSLRNDIQKQIEVLEQYKKSVITEAVTKGINPDVKMKDSGSKWIPSVPAHWNMDKLKYNLTVHEIKGFGDKEVLSLYRELGIVPKNSRDDNHNVTSEDTSKYKYVRKGDFVINKMKAWQGSVAVSDYKGIVSPAYYVYEFTNEKYDKKYFHHLMRNKILADEFRRISGGIREGQWDLDRIQFENMYLPVPPQKEQIEIANFIESKYGNIEKVIESKKQQLEKLEEYKKSLIFEYVTGKKEC